MSVYEGEQVGKPRRIGVLGWVAVAVMYAGVLVGIGAAFMWLGGGAP